LVFVIFNIYFQIDTVSTLAGSVAGNVDGNGLDAHFRHPIDLCLNPHDSCLYVSDYGNSAIKKVTLQGYFPTCHSLSYLLISPSLSLILSFFPPCVAFSLCYPSSSSHSPTSFPSPIPSHICLNQFLGEVSTILNLRHCIYGITMNYKENVFFATTNTHTILKISSGM
jgi:hypothetical protein